MKSLRQLQGLGSVLGEAVSEWFPDGGIALKPNAGLHDALIPLFLYIRDRRGHLIRLQHNAAQLRFAGGRTNRNIILKARQVGMTTYIAARFFLATILQPGTVTLQVAHSLESAQQIFRIVHRFLANLDEDLGPVICTTRANVRELAFAALDSRYIVDTAGNRNAGRGLTVHNLHASEVALWPGDAAESMAALLASVPPAGHVEIESTPYGVGGYFHSEWLRATGGEGLTPHFFPWWIESEYRHHPAPGESLEPFSDEERKIIHRHGLDLAQIGFRRHLRATFGNLAPQEFAESPADCFLVSGRPVFDVPAVDDRMRNLPAPIETALNGAFQVWKEPQRSRCYLIGADVAEGGERGDYSAAVVLDEETGLQCAELRARWPIVRFAEELARLGRRYGDALIAVERNNHGHAVLFALEQEFCYPRIYRHVEKDGGPGKAGWPMNVQTKRQAISLLERILREAPGIFASPRLLEECRSFAYLENGEAGARPGTHDDLVIAAAIALAVRARAGHAQFLAAKI